jgi:glycosyltransferase involved in cell wall biosynthesis
MTLTFVTNLVHHHQLPLADEFYKLLGDNYHYIATQPLPDWLIKGGYDPTLDRPYIIRTYSSSQEMDKARLLIDSSDVVIMGDSPLDWAIKRKKEGKVTFHFSERIYKERIPWLKLPKHAYLNYKRFRRFKNTYLLCASAYTASDFALTGCFKGRSFKWGYMTKVDDFKVEALEQGASTSEITPLMWCARFLKLKHPELPVMLAERLKKKDYHFRIDMFGSGEQLENTRALIHELEVEDCVTLCGNRPNAEILQEMRRHPIFLFTSDRNEGWGAVLNESMSNGCVPVACEAIGSAPYLINNGVNGLLFKSCDINSLEKSVCKLLDNPEMIAEMSKAALNTMRNVWSPKVAANNFLELTDYILGGRLQNYNRMEGPASWD